MKRAKASRPRSFRRQSLRLAVVHHLQSMLNATQKTICRDERLRRAFADPAGTGEGVEGTAGIGGSQLRDPTAPDQLLCLGEELDLANAAAPEFDVVASDRNRPMALMGVDLALDRMDVADRGEIQIRRQIYGRR